MDRNQDLRENVQAVMLIILLLVILVGCVGEMVTTPGEQESEAASQSILISLSKPRYHSGCCFTFRCARQKDSWDAS